jgi:phosphate transport system substrate-binding protein
MAATGYNAGHLRMSSIWASALAIALCVLVAHPARVAGQAVTEPRTTPALPIAIIVNPQAPVDELTLAELRRVFRGERQDWRPGQPIVLLMRAPVAVERDLILARVYAMSEARFKQFWIARIFRDEAAMVPKILYSNQQIADLVATIPGGIGFVDAATVRPGLKVLRIDGRLPGQPGYVLQ